MIRSISRTSGIKVVACTFLSFAVACGDVAAPVDTGPSSASISDVDDVMIAFMKKYDVPGLSLAITKDEKLVYLKAYMERNRTVRR